MQNSSDGIAVPLSTFGGQSTELSPTDLPEGGSPDNGDVAFLPGSVLTRPGLSRVYANPPETGAIVYEQTFTSTAGKQINVVMYASGNVYSENFTDAPGTFVNICSVPANSRCKAAEAYGRLFMTFNDGFRGTDIPRQWDGVTLSRVSQDGPCANPTFGETIGASVQLQNSGATGSHTIVSLVSSDPTFTEIDVWVPS